MKHTRKINPLVLQMALIALLVSVSPAVAQTDSTTAGTTTTTIQATPNGSEFNSGGEAAPVRKDAWSWYWNEKAYLDTSNQNGFWGDDAISNFFKNICNSFVVPFWNAVMEYDFVRIGVLLILTGMLLGFGASLVMPKKSAK